MSHSQILLESEHFQGTFSSPAYSSMITKFEVLIGFILLFIFVLCLLDLKKKMHFVFFSCFSPTLMNFFTSLWTVCGMTVRWWGRLGDHTVSLWLCPIHSDTITDGRKVNPFCPCRRYNSNPISNTLLQGWTTISMLARAWKRVISRVNDAIFYSTQTVDSVRSSLPTILKFHCAEWVNVL